eukprot:Gregarina_sp_Poly_1__10429@NODE_752_length_6451_cov_91_298246_g257_i1_p3_GENE_NODE_752_length_6451_cov_91_298246_g257_i1NODE_752_length_6451_cov_91_298246_g257_i1_p3_ORF_typecomplete_len198_score22_01CPBP/PF02517_16/4_6e03CPBP/PF02517_16/0_00051_NODE_752_length_6451_cov_91_298246_g257_i1151744
MSYKFLMHSLVVTDRRPFPAEFNGRSNHKCVDGCMAFCAGLGPLIVMLVCLDGMLDSGLKAMFVMHFIPMLAIPILLVLFLYKDIVYYKCWWNSQIQFHLKGQLGWMLGLGVISCLYAVLGGQFVVLRLFTGPKGPLSLVRRLKSNLDTSDPHTVLSGFWFCLINPFIEEWFWRIWLFKVRIANVLRFRKYPPPFAN